MIRTVIVCGAGTMGSGIAYTSALYGYPTVLYDISNSTLNQARLSILKQLEQQEQKGKISREKKESVISLLHITDFISECKGDLVIEAIAEIPDLKARFFEQVSELNNADTIFATNTSSLSVTKIGNAIADPSRFCGLHFFNPAPVMKLVEIFQTEKTDAAVIAAVFDFAVSLNKTAVICKDSPGFIVNRVARHFYLESLKLAEENAASPEQIDLLLENTGFKMGPFRLMDLIGNDINLAVTKALYESFDNAIRFRPSALQERKVENGELGRKTGKGYYNYDSDKQN